jgi:hypothetical protein
MSMEEHRTETGEERRGEERRGGKGPGEEARGAERTRDEGRGEEGGGKVARQPTPAHPYAHAHQAARQFYSSFTPTLHQL